MKDDERTPPGRRSGPSRGATLLLLGAVLGAAVVLFAWMNTESVPVTVFLWEPEVPKALLMFAPLLVGFLFGWGMAALRERSRRRGKEARPGVGRQGSDDRQDEGGPDGKGDSDGADGRGRPGP